MKNYEEEPVMGSTENKMPTTMCIRHADLPGIGDAAPGDRVKLIVEGHVHANRAGDKYGDGEAQVDIHSIEQAEPVKKENAATMHMDKLKSKIAKKEEIDDEKADKEAGVEEKKVEAEEKD